MWKVWYQRNIFYGFFCLSIPSSVLTYGQTDGQKVQNTGQVSNSVLRLLFQKFFKKKNIGNIIFNAVCSFDSEIFLSSIFKKLVSTCDGSKGPILKIMASVYNEMTSKLCLFIALPVCLLILKEFLWILRLQETRLFFFFETSCLPLCF